MGQAIRRLNGRRHRAFRALAADGDGTLLRGTRFGEATQAALSRLRRAGKKVFLTTGETPDDLAEFPHLNLFDLVIAENGALLYDPARKDEQPLAEPPPSKLVRGLKAAGVKPLKMGRVIISTELEHRSTVAEVIRKLQIGWHIVANRRQIMILPVGVNKASGLKAALKRFKFGCCDVIAIGDAENDVDLFRVCQCGVAVANAVPELKKKATFVTAHGVGAGVVELIRSLL
jgi:hydroxymethylpyrimidine pyrophosphatase-like HAD family hydrolase